MQNDKIKARILFVGHHPTLRTGNGNMLAELMARIDTDKFEPSVLAITAGVVNDVYSRPSYPIIEGGLNPNDNMGERTIEAILRDNDKLQNPVDIMFFVGLDLWQYTRLIPLMKEAKKKSGISFISLFPYDAMNLRPDWVGWLQHIDIPCVYSEYGYNILKDAKLPNLRYFRPPMFGKELFQKYSPEKKAIIKSKFKPTLKDDTFVFGFVGNNQQRKDIQRLMKAFSIINSEFPNTALYLHTELNGYFNIRQYSQDLGFESGDGRIFVKQQGAQYDTKGIVDTYNLMDCYVSPSLQEGLNWTIVEAISCGVPVIASEGHAHTELVKDVGCLIEQYDLTYTPLYTGMGRSMVEMRSCNIAKLIESMKEVYSSEKFRNELSDKSLKKAEEWHSGCGDINELLSYAVKLKIGAVVQRKTKKDGILFAQHSSAGDVLMSTQCFQGIKKKHPNKKLVYMTQKIYQDIVTNNPYIDEIIDWDEDQLKEYDIVYNPHGEKILPGGWNNLDVTLHSMYPYFCNVVPDEMFIDYKQVEMPEGLPEKLQDFKNGYIVVHTTGGSIQYRCYKHMDFVIQALKIPCVQVGGIDDLACDSADLDLRGKLTFRQTACVMKNAKAAIVIDSFPSHLAGALGTPVVVLYGPAPARVVQPKGDPDKIINLQPDMLKVCPTLSHCWSTPADPANCTSPCINTIHPMKVVRAVKSLL